MSKVRITHIHRHDAWFSERDEILGLEGMADRFIMTGHELYSFDFIPEGLKTSISFSFANFEIIEK